MSNVAKSEAAISDRITAAIVLWPADLVDEGFLWVPKLSSDQETVRMCCCSSKSNICDTDPAATIVKRRYGLNLP